MTQIFFKNVCYKQAKCVALALLMTLALAIGW